MRPVKRLNRINNRLNNNPNMNAARRDSLTARRDNLQSQVDAGPKPINKIRRINERLRGNPNMSDERRAKLEGRRDKWRDMRPRNQQPEVTPEVEVTTPEPEAELAPGLTGPEPQPQPVPQEPDPAVMKNLLPNYRENEFYDYEKSDLYDMRMEDGQKALDRYYASRGLTKSGAEAEGMAKLVRTLSGEEANRAQDIMARNADRAQRSADRFYNMTRDEAAMQNRQNQQNFDNYLSITDRMLNQSPIQYGYGAAGDMANLKGQYANDMYSIYQNSQAGRGGGGGGGGAYMAPPPAGPDYGVADLFDIYNSGSSNSGWGEAAGSFGAGLIGGLFGG